MVLRLCLPTTVKTPQANFVEHVHQMLGNMLRTKQLEQHTFDAKDPWSYILSQCAWAIHSTVHLILDATLAQLVFGHDMHALLFILQSVMA